MPSSQRKLLSEFRFLPVYPTLYTHLLPWDFLSSGISFSMLTQHFSEYQLKTTYIRIRRDLNQKYSFPGLYRDLLKVSKEGWGAEFLFQKSPRWLVCIRKLEDHCPQTLDSSCTKGHGDSMGLYKQVPSQRPRRQSSVVALITLLLKYRWKRQASVETELRHQHKCRLVSPAPWLLPITVARPARGLITCNL